MGFFFGGGERQGFVRTVGALEKNDPRHTKFGLRDRLSVVIKYDHGEKDASFLQLKDTIVETNSREKSSHFT